MTRAAPRLCRLSIVSTLYKSEHGLQEFLDRCLRLGKAFGEAFEIILVDDGSPDRSADIVKSYIQIHDSITLIVLSRNFGQHQAVRTGLEHASGELVFVLDSDLEEDPDCFQDLHTAITQNNADLAYGVRDMSGTAALRKIPSTAFYKLFNFLSAHPVEPNMTAARLMTRPFLDAFLTMEERSAFLPGLFSYTGFTQVTVPIVKPDSATTSYTLFRRTSLAVKALTSFSSRPLHFVLATGLLLSLAVLIAALVVLVTAVVERQLPTLSMAILLSIWAIGGLLTSTIGLVGLYTSRIFDEIKARPNTIIRSVHRKNSD